MKVEVSEGVLKLPAHIFIPAVPALVTLASLLAYHTFHEPPGSRVCHVGDKTYQRQWEDGNRPPVLSSKWLKVATHPGCSAEPRYTSRERCPTCFRPTVLREFNDSKFTAATTAQELSPRGPGGFFRPGVTPLQDVTNTALITPRDVCVETCPYLVVLVLSRQFDTRTRNDIRLTWASAAKTHLWRAGEGGLNADIGVIFVVAWWTDDSAPGNPKTPTDMAALLQEADVHNDILMLDMIDVYSNLTLKVASGLSWAYEHCRNTKFFLKIDQDTFFNVPMMLDLLIYHETRLELRVTGHTIADYRMSRYVLRDGRWGVDKVSYPLIRYPLYAAGCAYTLSRNATSRVISLFPYFPYLSIEDVFITGILGRAAGLSHVSPDFKRYFAEFSTWVTDWCRFLDDRLVTGTGVDAAHRLYNLWAFHVLNDGTCPSTNINDRQSCWLEHPRAEWL